MNERIRELAEQAREYAWENETHWSANAERDALFEQKFTELIVRECVEQGKQIQLQTVSNGSKDYVDGREMGIEVFMNQIKKHFGVEE